MPIGSIKTEADLARFVAQEIQSPDNRQAPALPFKTLRFGVDEVTFSESATAGVTVTHSVPAKPEAVFFQSFDTGTLFEPGSLDPSTFTATAERRNGASFSGSIGFFWVAIY
jgi:hypothetical protein